MPDLHDLSWLPERELQEWVVQQRWFASKSREVAHLNVVEAVPLRSETPMQWTGDRNGGFSRADFAQLYAPPLMDPVYGFQAVNVEAQLRMPTSLLRWMRRFIGLRKEHPVFGLGTYTPLSPSNPRVFAHVREYEDDVMLCVHNLARSAQAVELDLSAYEGRIPVEVFGRSRFPRIGELSYLLTLGPRGFYWFQLQEDEETHD